VQPSHRPLRILLASLLVLTLASQMSTSSAVNKASGICPKAGKIVTIKSFKYICQKSGKKLIWVKKVTPKPSATTIVKASPTNTPTPEPTTTPEQEPTSTPAPTTLPQVLLIEDLLMPISAKLQAADFSALTDLAQIHIDPLLADSQWSKDSVASLTMALRILKVLGVTPTNKLNIYISWGPDYRNQFTPDFCHSNSGGGSCGGGIIYADLLWFANNWGYGGVEKNYSDEMSKFGITANIPHEMGHVAQEESALAATNSDYWKYEPAWLREGGAEFFKVLSYSYYNKLSYKEIHDLYARNADTGCLSVPLSQMTGQGSYSHACEYTKGYFAAEYLVWKMASIDSLFQMVRTPGTDTASIFKAVYGFDESAFEKDADAYFAQVISSRT